MRFYWWDGTAWQYYRFDRTNEGHGIGASMALDAEENPVISYCKHEFGYLQVAWYR
jgi:hypothetical protein